MNKVLILGAGLVSKPMIEYLLERNIAITVASPMRERAEEMIAGNASGTAVDWSMDDPDELDRLVGLHDLTVSLLPYKFHTDVARVCLRHRKHLVTTSYVQPAMMELDKAAREAGVLFLNEVGLDPGIDHMSAMRIIDTVKSRGGNIEEFYSLCGALPAPEAADNPLGYKFSWSPKGVVLASRNGAYYLKHGKEVTIEAVNLFKDRFTHLFPGIGELEVYPNRDSVSYIDIYGLKGIKTMYRGTFRYKGWCETLDLMKATGLIDDGSYECSGKTYRQFVADKADVPGINIKKELREKKSLKATTHAIEAFEWLGLLSEEPVGSGIASPFDITSDRMIKKMWLNDNDRDMVVMQHLFLASYPGRKKEVISSTMLDFGTPATNTSIARTVALPASIAVKLILSGKINLAGVYRPVIPEIYEPILNELSHIGIRMNEQYGLPEEMMIK